mmetsp:Transcript_555/g.2292  ORF Transcript_555/g.2292 Transcript_555/m.2292 type:complete len:281 (+) Transcript_555:3984-4826(+)
MAYLPATFASVSASAMAPAGCERVSVSSVSIHRPRVGTSFAAIAAPPRNCDEDPRSLSKTENTRPWNGTPPPPSSEDEASHATRNLDSFVFHDGFSVCRHGLVLNLRFLVAPNAPTSTNGSEYPVKSAPLRPLHDTTTTCTCVVWGGSRGMPTVAAVGFSGVSPLALSSKESSPSSPSSSLAPASSSVTTATVLLPRVHDPIEGDADVWLASAGVVGCAGGSSRVDTGAKRPVGNAVGVPSGITCRIPTGRVDVDADDDVPSPEDALSPSIGAWPSVPMV